MARMKRPAYTVWVKGDGDDEIPHVVEIEWSDQLRGELEAGKYGVDTDAPMNLTTVWLWCAMTRTGLVKSRYPEWKSGELVGLEKVPTELPDVPPTGELDASASSSL